MLLYTRGADCLRPDVNSIECLEIKLKISFAPILRLLLQGHLTQQPSRLAVWLLLSAQWSGTLEGPLKKCGAGSHAALTPPLHHLTEPTHPGSGDSDPESDFPVQKDLLPVGRGADRGIVLPSSGSSGNKNLCNN